MATEQKTKRRKARVISAATWKRVENEYRANSMSLAEMGRLFNLSVNTITSRARRQGWCRDLGSAVEKATRAKVLADRAPVNATDEQIIEAVSAQTAEVLRTHREFCVRGRDQLIRLDAEIANAEIGEGKVTHEDGTQTKRVSVHAYAQLVTMRMGVMRTLIAEERQAFNVEGERNSNQEEAESLAEWMQSRVPTDANDESA